jgi:hypothetical protein
MTVEAKNGGEYCILNPKISNIDYKAYDKIKVVDGEYRCICRNRTVHIGFYECDEKGRQVKTGMKENVLLCCGFCGRIFNKNTLEIIRGIFVR